MMTTEMDLMRLDERQRLAWLLANRVTLMVVGITWIGMIAWEIAHARLPWFLMVMVPIFAAVRFAVFFYYQRMPT